jgi:hypothetical protein
MPDETKPPDNFDRLLKHLKNGSLAVRLVQAHRASGAASPSESMKAVLRARLEQVRGDLDSTKT